MPLYEYECKQCAYKFEELVSSNVTTVVCPRCSSTETRKLLSVFAATTSGGGDTAPSCSRPGCGRPGFS
ncbi:MAG: zinc ribbon domain-containing protein [Candidatus Zixiibacteriota bacterium]